MDHPLPACSRRRFLRDLAGLAAALWLGETWRGKGLSMAAAASAWCQQAPLFMSGRGGYHTYRIPALVVTPQGTILAFCEGRKHSAADHGDIDLLVRRSVDGGQTWDEPRCLVDAGAATAGNPAPVVDLQTGVVHLAFCIDNDTVWVTESQDDGQTWTTPREITGTVKRPEWTWYATGPCHGIQLRSGRLLIPCDHTGHAHVIVSDDHGRTWRLGGVVGRGTNESVAVETVDGSVYINCRNTRDTGQTYRAYAWSTDGGDSFSPVAWDPVLVEPICQASLVRLSTAAQHGKNRVLFANPASTKRERLTVRLSYDECRSWNAGKVLHWGPSAYSDLAVLPDGTICCLYERGERNPYETLTLARFNLAWLTDGQDTW